MARISLFKLTAIAYGIILSSSTAFITLAGAPGGGDTGRIHWKQIEDAQLKLDDKPPLTWNVFKPEKKKKDENLLLVLLGRRYLLLDVKAKLVYEVLPTDLHAQGKDFESDDLTKSGRLVPSTEWSDRDVGPAELIRLTLRDYGRVLEVSLAHMPDMRPFY
jgi:hypothetical protein